MIVDRVDKRVEFKLFKRHSLLNRVTSLLKCLMLHGNYIPKGEVDFRGFRRIDFPDCEAPIHSPFSAAPEPFALEIPNGIAYHSYPLDSQGRRLSCFPDFYSHWFQLRHPHGLRMASSVVSSSKIKRIPGTVVTTMCADQTLSHFLHDYLPFFDLIPKLQLQEPFKIRFNLSYSDLLPNVASGEVAQRFEQLKASGGDYKTAALKLAGVDMSQILPYEGNEIIQADKLIYIHTGCKEGKWIKEFLTDIYNRAAGDTRQEKGFKLFISRKDTKRCRTSYATELERLARRKGFEVVQLTGMSFEDQARLFRRASLVMQEHGSGMMHTYACMPGTPVIQLWRRQFQYGVSGPEFNPVYPEKIDRYDFIFMRGDNAGLEVRKFNFRTLEQLIDRIESGKAEPVQSSC